MLGLFVVGKDGPVGRQIFVEPPELLFRPVSTKGVLVHRSAPFRPVRRGQDTQMLRARCLGLHSERADTSEKGLVKSIAP